MFILFAAAITAAAAEPDPPRRIDLFGDFRLREESNFGVDGESYDRLTLRTRVGARLRITDTFTFGSRVIMSQGSRITDMSNTVSRLADSTALRLDHAYIRYASDDLMVEVGRFPNPFLKTELQLVWDNDFSPQGIAGNLRLQRAAPGVPELRIAAMYYPILLDAVGADSTMSGAQLIAGWDTAMPKVQLALGYYDYSLRGRPDTARDDFRGNLLTPRGDYLSDFDLVDVIADVSVDPFGAAWPLGIVANYTVNHGAATGDDTAYALDLYLGRQQAPGDWRFNYAYAMAEAESLFVAFSQDNIGIASNYRWHTFGLEYVAGKSVLLSATLYRYRPDDPRGSGDHEPPDWLNRFRFNVNVLF